MVEVETSLHEHLQKFFGFSKFKSSQEAIIQNILEGNDCFVIMPTGGGKSLCYQLPALISEGTAIIISPLIALMKNQVDSIRSFGTEDGIAHFLNSSLSKQEIANVKKDIVSGKTKLLYVAPESLTKQENIDFFTDIKISFFAIDEAHCISEWGHDFRPEYRRLRPMIEAIGKVPIMALTATATPKVQQDIQKNLGMTNAALFKESFNRPNLYYEVRPKINVLKDIIRFINNNAGKSGIIYCLSRKKVEEVAQTLQVNGIKALPYHAGLEATVRAQTQDKFLMEEIDVIVATIAFGMGIDKPDVRFVIHHDIPKSLEGYYQETGRGGRDGGEGICLAFYSYKDIEKLEKFLQGKQVAEQEIGRQLILETVSYAETAMCRRKALLHYFGEEYDDAKCDAKCDNCANPKPKFDGQEEILLLLQTVIAIKEKHKAKHIIHVLTGTENTAIRSYKHQLLEGIFGEGSDNDEKFWLGIIRQAIVHGFLVKDIETYGILRLSDKGHEFLKAPYSLMVSQDHDYENANDDADMITAGSAVAGAADEVLFGLLKDLRKKIAKEKNLPPFVIFQDTSLEDMVTNYPITMDEMKHISGVGAGKAIKFGKEFVEVIAKYVTDNEIERPQDLVVKSVVNKSQLKVYIIQNIDRKIPLDAIARSKGLEFSALLTEIESIVSSGTKVSINYFISQTMDEDKQDEIFEYFRTADNDSIKDAIDELGENDFTEEEVRLIRIKFMSEVGN